MLSSFLKFIRAQNPKSTLCKEVNAFPNFHHTLSLPTAAMLHSSLAIQSLLMPPYNSAISMKLAGCDCTYACGRAVGA